MREKLPPLPQYTSPGVVAASKGACGAYTDYATAYAAHDKQKLRVMMERHHEVFEKARLSFVDPTAKGS